MYLGAAFLRPLPRCPGLLLFFVPFSHIFPVHGDDFYFLTPVMGPLATFSESTDYRSIIGTDVFAKILLHHSMPDEALTLQI